MNRFYPKSRLHSVSDLSPEFFVSRRISLVIFDIDNTLASHRNALPSPEACTLLRSLQNAGLRVALISNNKAERVDAFNAPLSLFAAAHAGKPKKRALIPILQHFNALPEDCALVGDQLFTDVFLANRCGVYSVLVDPIEPYENAFFRLKRALEKPILFAYEQQQKKRK